MYYTMSDVLYSMCCTILYKREYSIGSAVWIQYSIVYTIASTQPIKYCVHTVQYSNREYSIVTPHYRCVPFSLGHCFILTVYLGGRRSF